MKEQLAELVAGMVLRSSVNVAFLLVIITFGHGCIRFMHLFCRKENRRLSWYKYSKTLEASQFLMKWIFLKIFPVSDEVNFTKPGKVTNLKGQ